MDSTATTDQQRDGLTGPAPGGHTSPRAGAPGGDDRSGEEGGDQRLDARVLAVVRAFLSSSWRVGRDPGAQLERLARSFVRRIVSGAVESPRPVTDGATLRRVLGEPPANVALSTGTAALVAGKVLRRLGPLKTFAKRTPVVAAAAALPEVYSAMSRGVEDLATVASFLTHRAGESATRAGAGEPDPDRIRRVTVQLLTGERIDPDTEPEHDRLVWSWLRRAARGLLPFARSKGTPDAKRIAAVAAAIEPHLLLAR